MRVLVFGASGILGQHLRLAVPQGIEPLWYRHHPDPITPGFDLLDTRLIPGMIGDLRPDVVVNLAGEADVDRVEAAHLESESLAAEHYRLNVLVPEKIARTCADLGIRYVHVSSQAVFDGKLHPYYPHSPQCAVNEYGSQKIRAEAMVEKYPGTVIVRPSLVLGVRPMPNSGRKNPIEGMLDGSVKEQVADRWFSPLFARDAAEGIWRVVTGELSGNPVHLGIPRPWSRFEIAEEVGAGFVPAKHDSFPGIAPRPLDTTYGEGSWFSRLVDAGVVECREDTEESRRRAREIALYLGIGEVDALTTLCCGFGRLHQAVTEDFNRAGAGKDEETLLDWYRSTEAYIWELTAYHLDPRFNYRGMVEGIVERLKPAVGEGQVLCLGDGIGDLTLALKRAGIDSFYHDLKDSRTMRFAEFRYWNQTGEHISYHVTDGWAPDFRTPFPGTAGYRAVVACDFLEHVPNVEEWVRAVHGVLVPGGLFVTFNSFAQGSGENGEMPMHLALNDHYEQDWDTMLREIGFRQTASNYYERV